MYQHIVTSNGQQYTLTNNLPPDQMRQRAAQMGIQYVSSSGGPQGTSSNPFQSNPTPSTATTPRTNPMRFKNPQTGDIQTLGLTRNDVTGNAGPQLQSLLQQGYVPMDASGQTMKETPGVNGGSLWTDSNGMTAPLNVHAGFGWLPGQQAQVQLMNAGGQQPGQALPTQIQWPAQGAGSLTLKNAQGDTQVLDASQHDQINNLLHSGYQALNENGKPWISVNYAKYPGAQMFINPDTGDIVPLNVMLGGQWTQPQLAELPSFLQTPEFKQAIQGNPNVPVSGLAQTAMNTGQADLMGQLQSGYLTQPFTQQFNYPNLSLDQVAAPWNRNFSPGIQFPSYSPQGGNVPGYSPTGGPIPGTPNLSAVPGFTGGAPPVPSYSGAGAVPTYTGGAPPIPTYQNAGPIPNYNPNAAPIPGAPQLGPVPLSSLAAPQVPTFNTSGVPNVPGYSPTAGAVPGFTPPAGAALPGPFTPPTGQDLLNQDPGYQFVKQQGLLAVDRQEAAAGNSPMGGRALLDVGDYVTELASREYDAGFQRRLAEYQQNLSLAQIAQQQGLSTFQAGLTGQQQQFQQGATGYQLGLSGQQQQYQQQLAAYQAQLAAEQQQFGQPLSLYQTALGAQSQQAQQQLAQYQAALGGQAQQFGQGLQGYQAQLGAQAQQYGENLGAFQAGLAGQQQAFAQPLSLYQTSLGAQQQQYLQGLGGYQAQLAGQQQAFTQPLSLYQTSLGAQSQQVQQQLAAYQAALSGQQQGFTQGLAGFGAGLQSQQQGFTQGMQNYSLQQLAATDAYSRALQDYLNQQQTFYTNQQNLSNQYQAGYGRAFGEFATQFDIQRANQNDIFNKLAAVSGLGQTTGVNLGQLGANYAGLHTATSFNNAASLADLNATAATAQGAGAVRSANTWGNFFNTTANDVLGRQGTGWTGAWA